MDPNPDAMVSIERGLFNTLLDITGRPHFSVFSYEGRTVVFRLLDQARQLYEANESAVRWLESAAKSFTDVLIEAEYLSNEERNLFAMSVEEMKTDMRNNKVDLDNLAIDDWESMRARTRP
jgi:DNA helicase-2/ATP-dependent DNA helicase PcrA